MYSISRIQDRGPSKIYPWPTGWETLPYNKNTVAFLILSNTAALLAFLFIHSEVRLPLSTLLAQVCTAPMLNKSNKFWWASIISKNIISKSHFAKWQPHNSTQRDRVNKQQEKDIAAFVSDVWCFTLVVLGQSIQVQLRGVLFLS